MGWLTPQTSGGIGAWFSRAGVILEKIVIVFAIIYLIWALGHFVLIPSWKPGPDPYSVILGWFAQSPQWLVAFINIVGLPCVIFMAVLLFCRKVAKGAKNEWAWLRS